MTETETSREQAERVGLVPGPVNPAKAGGSVFVRHATVDTLCAHFDLPRAVVEAEVRAAGFEISDAPIGDVVFFVGGLTPATPRARPIACTLCGATAYYLDALPPMAQPICVPCAVREMAKEKGQK